MNNTHLHQPDGQQPYSVGPNTRTFPVDAAWRHNRQPEQPIVSSHRPAPRKAGPVAGERVELARYTVARGGDRIVYAQRVHGRVRVTDRPAGRVTAENRAHLIENDLDSKAELDALVADYLAEAQRLQAIPATAIPYEIALAELVAR